MSLSDLNPKSTCIEAKHNSTDVIYLQDVRNEHASSVIYSLNIKKESTRDFKIGTHEFVKQDFSIINLYMINFKCS